MLETLSPKLQDINRLYWSQNMKVYEVGIVIFTVRKEKRNKL